jgi:ribosomal protein S18 acetylase RimI-like enzyme
MDKSGISFRRGNGEDAITISALAVQVFLDTYATAGVRPDLALEAFQECSASAFAVRLSEPNRTFLLAEEGVGLVAFAEIIKGSIKAPVAELQGAELVRLYVQPAAQRTGLGRRLLEAAERVAVDAACPLVWLTAWEHNHRAIAFYRRLGYSEVGVTTYRFRNNTYGNRVFAKRGDTVQEIFTWQLGQKRYFDPTFGGALIEGRRNVFDLHAAKLAQSAQHRPEPGDETADRHQSEHRLFAGPPALVAADIRALRDMGVGSLDFGFGGSTADEVLAGMQKFRAEVLPLV